MIISELKKREKDFGSKCKVGDIILNQRCIIKCDNCGKEFSRNYRDNLFRRNKYKKDICRGCMQIEQYKKGTRNNQKIKAREGAIKNLKGKTFEEIYGIDKAKELKLKGSLKFRGSNNPNYGGKYSHGFGHSLNQPSIKGKTWEEIYGVEKAKNIKDKISKKLIGENSPNFGHPCPQGCGNGWSGWYKDWFFRSLKELFYMINIIEKQNLNWISGESYKYKISYINWNKKQKNYFPDFIIEDKFMIEIKPKRLRNSKNVLLKESAAILWCKNNHLEYKIVTDNEFKLLTNEQIKKLHDSNKIKFINRYEEKYNNEYN